MLTNGKKYTLACWVKATGINNNGWAVKFGTTQNGLWWAKSEPRWVWNENDNGKRVIGAPIANDYTNWHHLVTTVDKTDPTAIVAKHYVDGQPAEGYASQTWNNGSFTLPAGDNITIYPQNAQLCDVRLYNNVLTAEEIKEIAKAKILHIPLINAPFSNLYSSSLKLPAEYQEVEYIQSTGTQYINTGINPTAKSRFTMRFFNPGISGNQGIAGVSNGNIWGQCEWSLWYNGANIDYSRPASSTTGATANLSNVYQRNTNYYLDFSTTILKLNASTSSPSTLYADYQSVRPFTIFVVNRESLRNYGTLRLYHFSFFEDGLEISNLIPCYRKSDGVIGLYDTIRNQFLTNAGTGTFICGPAKGPIPIDYVPCEWLKSTGTQWINSGFTRTSANFKIISKHIISDGGERDMFGSYSSSTAVCSVMGIAYSPNELFIYNKGQNNARVTKPTYKNDQLQTVEWIMQTGSHSIIVDGGTPTSVNCTIASPEGNPMYIFSGGPGNYNNSQAKIYTVDIFQDGIPVRCLRPVLRVSDRKPGFYDILDGTFYVNGGSGEFTYGKQLNEYDISGFSNHFTCSDEVKYPSFTNSIIYNKYLHLTDGRNSHETLRLLNCNIPITNTLTWCAWFRSTNTSPYGSYHVILAGNPTGGWVELDVHASQSLRLGIQRDGASSTSYNDFSTTTLLNGNWHHLCGVFDGTNIKAYIDGEFKSNAALSGTTKLITGLNIGNWSAGDSYACNNVDISDLRIYNTVLSADDILKLYQMGNLN